MKLSLKDKEAQIIQEFDLFDDWMDKYTYIIELGKTLPIIDDKYKTDNYLIKGCQSQVWIFAEFVDGYVVFTADSDAIITKGIANLLIKVLSNSTPDEIINSDLDFVNKIGLKEHLSPTRANGLNALIKQMKLFAMAFKVKTENKS